MMRHILVPILLVLSFVGAPGASWGVPVYLRVDSRFPSGHHPRPALESRLRKVQFQRWFQVKTKDGAFGWINEDSLVTALKLSTQGTLLEDAPARTEKQLDTFPNKMILKGKKIFILEVDGSWVRGLPIPEGEKEVHAKEAWFPSEIVRPMITRLNANSPYARVYVPPSAKVRLLPASGARTQERIRTPSILVVDSHENGWIEVLTRASSRATAIRGFLKSKEAITAQDLGEKEVRTIEDLTPLRSAPLPYADLVRSLPGATKLEVLGTQTLRWGLSKVPEGGEMWWPIPNEKDDDKPLLQLERLASEELFRRKIFDMASSPAIPSLKFASAGGVFRTVDGRDWVKIPSFDNKNYPIAIAAQGSVFVGPLVSDDHGETFEQWIRWDSLVSAMRPELRVQPRALQILEIKPQDPEGQSVLLKLNIGSGKQVQMKTDDQGSSWRQVN